MLSEQFGPLFLKSVVTISINTPQGTISSNCQIGAEAARALNGNKTRKEKGKKNVTHQNQVLKLTLILNKNDEKIIIAVNEIETRNLSIIEWNMFYPK